MVLEKIKFYQILVSSHSFWINSYIFASLVKVAKSGYKYIAGVAILEFLVFGTYTTNSEMIDKLTFIDLDPDFPHEIV